MTTELGTARTLAKARAILAEEGITDPIWLGEVDDSDRLGITLESHLLFLTDCREEELRGWARSVADDQS